MFVYSVRFRRRAVTRPGSGVAFRSTRASSDLEKADQRVDLRSWRCATPEGGISPERSLRQDADPNPRGGSRAIPTDAIVCATSSPPSASTGCGTGCRSPRTGPASPRETPPRSAAWAAALRRAAGAAAAFSSRRAHVQRPAERERQDARRPAPSPSFRAGVASAPLHPVAPAAARPRRTSAPAACAVPGAARALRRPGGE